MLKVCTLFSGYDSQCMGLDRLHADFPQFDYELVAWSDIDRYAIQAHNAVYPQYSEFNLGDVCKIDWSKVPAFDLLTYSSQLYKLAGNSIVVSCLYHIFRKLFVEIQNDDKQLELF